MVVEFDAKNMLKFMEEDMKKLDNSDIDRRVPRGRRAGKHVVSVLISRSVALSLALQERQRGSPPIMLV